MAISYKWDVSQCDVYPSKSSKSNVVNNVRWRLTAEDDSNQDADSNNIIATVYGTQELDTSDLSSFINWSDLKTSDVEGWVENAMGSTEVARLKSSLDQKISKQISPSSETKTLT